ncbi:MAG: hypothetical protein AB8H03_04155 [Saprospiraceae bacterium]
MKEFIQIVLLFLCVNSLHAQDNVVLENGKVTFITTKNIYVKFNSTKNINVGDTLYLDKQGQLISVLKIENKSSSSTVCIPLGTQRLKKGDVIISRFLEPVDLPEPPVEEAENDLPFTEPEIPSNDLVVEPDEDKEENVLFKEKVKGRFSAASYNNLSDFKNVNRMRYAFSFRGYNLKDSRFSVENYITFRHTLNDSINIADALKVYSLNVKYDFNKNTSLTFGRKINPKFSSMGAIDGLQFEKEWNNFSIGAVAGTRPDFQNYGLNLALLQFGGYLSYGSSNPGKYNQTTIGFIEQMNKGNTDRRFVYLQHSSELAKGLHFFGSMEVDLFENINNEVKSKAQLTNLYASLRYRLNKRMRFSASYDTRKNIVYYESYKNFIDQFIDDETRQGLRVGVSHRPFKKISWGVNASRRFQNSQRNTSQSASAYFTYSSIPFIKARATVRANFLQTDFLDSQIFGARLSKELIKGKLNGDIYYRWVDYKYKVGDRVLHQNIAGVNFSYRIQKQLSLHLFYEGVMDNNSQIYHRVNAKIIKRF